MTAVKERSGKTMAGYKTVPTEKTAPGVIGAANPEYANSTQYMKSNGRTYAVTYGPNGEFHGSTLVPDYDYDLSVDRAALGGSAYDQLYMTNTELGKIADARKAAQDGTGSWAEANKLAEDIRGAYGYSGGADGTGYVPTGSKNVYSGVSPVRDPATLLSLDKTEEQRLANWLAGNYGNNHMTIKNGRVTLEQGTGTPAGIGGYEDFVKRAEEAKLMGQFTPQDLEYARMNPAYGNALLQSKMNWNKASTPEQRALAEAQGAALRDTIRSSTPQRSGDVYAGYDTAAGTIQGIGGSAGGGETDSGTDLPAYGGISGADRETARLAMQSALSQASARTGGLASSYAETAAQNIYQQYLAQAEQEAYEQYAAALKELEDVYDLQSAGEDTIYQRYLEDNDVSADTADYTDILAQLAALYTDQSAQQTGGYVYTQPHYTHPSGMSGDDIYSKLDTVIDSWKGEQAYRSYADMMADKDTLLSIIDSVAPFLTKEQAANLRKRLGGDVVAD